MQHRGMYCKRIDRNILKVSDTIHIHNNEGQWVRVLSPLRKFSRCARLVFSVKRGWVWLAGFEMAGFFSVVNIGC